VSLAEAWEFFRWSILAILATGLAAPVLGAFLLLRRTSFHGLALPQFAAAGIAVGFLLLPWVVALGAFGSVPVEEVAGDSHAAHSYHLIFAALGTFIGLAALVAPQDRLGMESARMAGAFATASAVTILCANASPFGEIFVNGILTGESLVVGPREFATLATTLAVSVVLLFLLRHDLVLASLDREAAIVHRRPVRSLEAVFAALLGGSIAVGTMSVGPVMLFGLLVLPPLGARRLATSVRSFFALSAAVGLASTAAGLLASFWIDLPPAPCVVAAAAIATLPGALFPTRG